MLIHSRAAWLEPLSSLCRPAPSRTRRGVAEGDDEARSRHPIRAAAGCEKVLFTQKVTVSRPMRGACRVLSILLLPWVCSPAGAGNAGRWPAPAYEYRRTFIGWVEDKGDGGRLPGPRLNHRAEQILSTSRPCRRPASHRLAQPFSSFFSTTIASVVSSRPAIDAAFCSAVRVDLGRVNHAGRDQVLVLSVSAL